MPYNLVVSGKDYYVYLVTNEEEVQVLEQLHKFDLLKDYSKTRKYFTQEGNDIYKRLKPYLEEAIANSKTTGEFDYENLEKGFCSMHKLFSGLELDAVSGQMGIK